MNDVIAAIVRYQEYRKISGGAEILWQGDLSTSLSAATAL